MVTMSEQEYEVLEEKLNNPEKKVICPRCGNEIIYEKNKYQLKDTYHKDFEGNNKIA